MTELAEELRSPVSDAVRYVAVDESAGSARFTIGLGPQERRAVLVARNQLLASYLRRVTDERSVRCSQIRLLADRQAQELSRIRDELRWLAVARGGNGPRAASTRAIVGSR